MEKELYIILMEINNIKSEKGIYYWKDGNKYEGDFINGIRKRKVHIIIYLEINMLEILKIIKEMDLAFIIIIMEMYMKEIIKMI